MKTMNELTTAAAIRYELDAEDMEGTGIFYAMMEAANILGAKAKECLDKMDWFERTAHLDDFSKSVETLGVDALCGIYNKVLDDNGYRPEKYARFYPRSETDTVFKGLGFLTISEIVREAGDDYNGYGDWFSVNYSVSENGRYAFHNLTDYAEPSDVFEYLCGDEALESLFVDAVLNAIG